MSNIPIETTCPLGATCEEVRDGKIHRCIGWQKLIGKDPQTGEPRDEWGCSLFTWLPILLVENASTNRGQTQALESFRNAVVQGNGQLMAVIANTKRQQAIDHDG